MNKGFLALPTSIVVLLLLRQLASNLMFTWIQSTGTLPLLQKIIMPCLSSRPPFRQ